MSSELEDEKSPRTPGLASSPSPSYLSWEPKVPGASTPSSSSSPPPLHQKPGLVYTATPPIIHHGGQCRSVSLPSALSLSLSLSDVDQTPTESYHPSEGAEPLGHHEDMSGGAAHDESHGHGGGQFSNSFESEQTRVPGADPTGPAPQRKSSKDYSHTDEWGTPSCCFSSSSLPLPHEES